MYQIKVFERRYRDDVIFCLLSAKDALGRVPCINEDLWDIEKNYLEKGDMFWIAVDRDDRVAGILGTNTVTSVDMWLKRFYVKPSYKRKGIGGALLGMAEDFAGDNSLGVIHTRFSDDYSEAYLFYTSKGFIESERSDGLRHLIKHIQE